MKSFETWLFDEVEITFGIKRTFDSVLLNNLLLANQIPDSHQRSSIENLQKNAFLFVDTWNEDEIKFHFIAPFVQLIDFITENFKSFTQRTLSANINGTEVGGRVDFMVAKGKSHPKHPFFFFNEYKPSKRGNNDPLGQLLIEMVTAQFTNADNLPIYGAYTEGRFWYFVILNDKEYAISRAFDATEADIFKIFSILWKIKEIITDFATR